MARAEKLEWPDGEYACFRCPGCGETEMHVIPVTGPRAWGFNGSWKLPTFTPSILARSRFFNESHDRVCHSIVTNGRIQYLTDCTHALAEQTVDLPEIKAEKASGT